MIWTGSPGQVATTWFLVCVPGMLWQSLAIYFEWVQGHSTAAAFGLATIVTGGWLAVTLTPTVRRMVVRCIFPEHRPDRDIDPDGHDLAALAARVREVLG